MQKMTAHPLSARHKARELALQALYEIDLTGHGTPEVMGSLTESLELTPENADFALDLVRGVLANRSKIDDYIHRFAPAWPLTQMAAIDRNILRLAIYELLLNNMVPVKVAINEAVELAKSFGSDSSPRFVNGVLSSVSNLAAR
jgi:transcription antitermination protein NusB